MKEQTQVNKLEYLCLNSTDKLAKEWFMYGNKNSKRFEISAEKNIISDYVLLLSVLNVFTVGIEEYYPNCNNLNDAKSLQVLCHYWNITLRLQVANQ